MLKNFWINLVSLSLLTISSCFATEIASCTAFYINNTTVATAAHCVRNTVTQHIIKGHKLYDLKLIAVDFNKDVAIFEAPYNLYYYTLNNTISPKRAFIIGFPIPDIRGYTVSSQPVNIKLNLADGFLTGGGGCHGNSGGPLVDQKGEVIGTVDMGFGQGDCTYYGESLYIQNIIDLARKYNIDITISNNTLDLSDQEIYNQSLNKVFLYEGVINDD